MIKYRLSVLYLFIIIFCSFAVSHHPSFIYVIVFTYRWVYLHPAAPISSYYWTIGAISWFWKCLVPVGVIFVFY